MEFFLIHFNYSPACLPFFRFVRCFDNRILSCVSPFTVVFCGKGTKTIIHYWLHCWKLWSVKWLTRLFQLNANTNFCPKIIPASKFPHLCNRTGSEETVPLTELFEAPRFLTWHSLSHCTRIWRFFKQAVVKNSHLILQ